ncbi:transcriptional regulator, LysR family [Rhizobiales bacterium GAS113]|nr:transcriptional regulator, LysR family [Rhizobiales bacterium GAS113]SED46858.1 transcriptional regulator, LysR family [Rhizobiales bacterium GAS188]
MGKRVLPPLSALRAFEAAARHMSFVRAAEELNVTPSAVSHQVKLLETWLEARLFHRGARPSKLTDRGQTYFRSVERAFDLLASATSETRTGAARSSLTVATMDSFASNWLVPRLHRFRSMHPTLDIRITLDDRMVDFVKDAVDIAIRYGRGRWPGAEAELLFDEEVFPVCCPSLMTGAHPLGQLADLRFHTLLHDSARIGWARWLKEAALDDVIDASKGPVFGRSYLAIQAAGNCEGVALASGPLVSDAIARGQLIRPFDTKVVAEDAYFLVYRAQTPIPAKVASFRKWLLDERSCR